jgi:hypothetical protein
LALLQTLLHLLSVPLLLSLTLCTQLVLPLLLLLLPLSPLPFASLSLLTSGRLLTFPSGSLFLHTGHASSLLSDPTFLFVMGTPLTLNAFLFLLYPALTFTQFPLPVSL